MNLDILKAEDCNDSVTIIVLARMLKVGAQNGVSLNFWASFILREAIISSIYNHQYTFSYQHLDNVLAFTGNS